jgi:hypothetical protein
MFWSNRSVHLSKDHSKRTEPPNIGRAIQGSCWIEQDVRRQGEGEGSTEGGGVPGSRGFVEFLFLLENVCFRTSRPNPFLL